MQELIVVTVLVAVRGGLKMPRVTSGEELKTALNRLGAIRSEQVRAAPYRVPLTLDWYGRCS